MSVWLMIVFFRIRFEPTEEAAAQLDRSSFSVKPG